MAIPEQFSLRWNDFHTNLLQSFHSLLEDDDFVDVTLAAGGQYVRAHKLILSACSPYFKELFKVTPCEHPIVILKDVEYQELRQLLHFMYRGEVNVRGQELSAFLHTAEMLQVKGLSGGRDRSESPSPMQVQSPQRTALQQEACETGNDFSLDDATSETTELNETIISEPAGSVRSPLKRLLKDTPIKTSPGLKRKRIKESPTHSENTDNINDGEPLIDFDNEFFHSVLVKPESTKESGWNCKSTGVKCPSCPRFFANRYNMKVHIRDKHDTREGTLQCDICHKRMRNPSCLRVHMYHHRKQAAYNSQLSQSLPNLQNMVAVKCHPDSLSTSDESQAVCSVVETYSAFLAQATQGLEASPGPKISGVISMVNSNEQADEPRGDPDTEVV